MDTSTKTMSYEERVQRNIEENRKLLRDLGLTSTSDVPESKEIKPRQPRKSVTRKPNVKPPESQRSSICTRRSSLFSNANEDLDSSHTADKEENTPQKRRVTYSKEPSFGEIEGVSVGDWWMTRLECSAAGVHRPTVAGIHGKADEGCYSIALSGGYEDDIDSGDFFTYTGSGGRDLRGTKMKPKNLRTAPQSKDQVLEGCNAALALNIETKNPVRVIRGYKLQSPYAPEEGYRYDGLYSVEKQWMAQGLSGFKVVKFALKRIPDQDPAPWESCPLILSPEKNQSLQFATDSSKVKVSLSNGTSGMKEYQSLPKSDSTFRSLSEEAEIPIEESEYVSEESDLLNSSKFTPNLPLRPKTGTQENRKISPANNTSPTKTNSTMPSITQSNPQETHQLVVKTDNPVNIGKRDSFSPEVQAEKVITNKTISLSDEKENTTDDDVDLNSKVNGEVQTEKIKINKTISLSDEKENTTDEDVNLDSKMNSMIKQTSILNYFACVKTVSNNETPKNTVNPKFLRGNRIPSVPTNLPTDENIVSVSSSRKRKMSSYNIGSKMETNPKVPKINKESRPTEMLEKLLEKNRKIRLENQKLPAEECSPIVKTSVVKLLENSLEENRKIRLENQELPAVKSLPVIKTCVVKLQKLEENFLGWDYDCCEEFHGFSESDSNKDHKADDNAILNGFPGWESSIANSSSKTALVILRLLTDELSKSDS